MKNADKSKQKAEKRKFKILKPYYKKYAIGDGLFDSKYGKCIVIGKHKLDNEYYFVVQDIYGNVYLQKLVYSSKVRVVNVSREGNQYNKNKTVFDTWFQKAQTKRTIWLERYYKKTLLGEANKYKNHTLVLKKKYNGNYYFILRDSKWKYVVCKLGWWYTNVKLEMLSEKEFNENKVVFYGWITEAKLLYN